MLGERLGRVDVFELRPRIGLAQRRPGRAAPARPSGSSTSCVTGAYAIIGPLARARTTSSTTTAPRELLAQLGVGQLAERTFGTLSEGERKRVQIARALMADPELLLLDEPAAGLDLGGREDLVRRLAALAADPYAPAIVLVTHHVEEIPPGFTHVLLLRGGRVVAAGPDRRRP